MTHKDGHSLSSAVSAGVSEEALRDSVTGSKSPVCTAWKRVNHQNNDPGLCKIKK